MPALHHVGEYIRRAGTPTYAPTGGVELGDADRLPGGRAMGYLLVLAVEELLDMCNRATTRDEALHLVSRLIAKIHVLEEARHLSFAKTFLFNVWPTLPVDERAGAAALAPAATGFVTELTVNDDVNRTLGIAGGAEAARSNPAHHARIVRDLSKLVGFLEDLGVIDERNRGV